MSRAFPAAVPWAIVLTTVVMTPGCDQDTYLVSEIASLREEPTAVVIASTGNTRWEYRAAAFVVLRDRTDDPAGMAAAALAALDDPEARVRAHAADILQSLGRRVSLDSLDVAQLPDGTVARLAATCLDPEWFVRISALGAVGELGPRAASAVPAIGVNLEHPHPFVRSQAVWALGHVGPAARDFLPRLRDMAMDTSPVVRLAVPAAVRGVAGADTSASSDREEIG